MPSNSSTPDKSPKFASGPSPSKVHPPSAVLSTLRRAPEDGLRRTGSPKTKLSRPHTHHAPRNTSLLLPRSTLHPPQYCPPSAGLRRTGYGGRVNPPPSTL